MDSLQVLENHIFGFKLGGLWPGKDASVFYHIYSYLLFIVVDLGFPLSQIVCVFFVGSVEEVVDHLVLTSTVWMASFKALNVYFHQSSLQELFEVLKRLDKNVKLPSDQRRFEAIFSFSRHLVIVSFFFYLSAWVCIALQVIFSPPEKVVWTSTLLYPYRWAQGATIYKVGLAFQAASNLYLCSFDALLDTYGVILLNILGGHIDALSSRMRAIGQAVTGKKAYAELVDCIRSYELCLRFDGTAGGALSHRLLIIFIRRYSTLLEMVLNWALFCQIGVSTLVICTCAYQLTTVRTE